MLLRHFCCFLEHQPLFSLAPSPDNPHCEILRGPPVKRISFMDPCSQHLEKGPNTYRIRSDQALLECSIGSYLSSMGEGVQLNHSLKRLTLCVPVGSLPLWREFTLYPSIQECMVLRELSSGWPPPPFISSLFQPSLLSWVWVLSNQWTCLYELVFFLR